MTTYLDVVVEDPPLYVDVQTTGGPPGPQGPAGPQGPPGADSTVAGPPGADGSIWYEGSGAPPTGLGKIGDFYFNRDSDAVWAKVSTYAGDPGSWLFQSDLTGSPGATGPAGPEGPVTSVASIVIDGGGAVITTGLKGAIRIAANSRIDAWEVVSVDGTTGSIVVELWADSYANFPPTAADIIGAAEKPTLASQVKNQDTSLNGGAGYPVTGGAWLAWNVASAAAVKLVTVALTLTRT